MSDCSPLRLADQGQSSSSPSQSSQNSGAPLDPRAQQPQGRVSHQHPMDNNSENNGSARTSRIQARSNQSPPSPTESTKSGQLKYGAKSVIDLFIPVSICMSIVVGTMKATDSYDYSSQSAIWYAQMMFTDETVGTETRLLHTLLNALRMLGLIICMTTLLFLLYKYKYYRIIYVWLLLSSVMLLLPFMVMYIAVFFKVYNKPMDYITLTLFIWNFAVVGIICIHWKGPLKLQQGYLIMISALMALVFIRCLPDWTVWSVLITVSVWDLVAVLCPYGPLRALVELAQERNEPIFPALIYSSTMIWEVAIISAQTIFNMTDHGESQHRPTSKRLDQQSSSSSSGSPRRTNRPRRNVDLYSSPRKRDNHPVEIHYEDGVDPPQVAIIQPNLTVSDHISDLRTNDEWSHADVRAVRIRTNRAHNPRQRRSAPQGGDSIINSSRQELGQQIIEEEERGVKLGLGDFIFFSVLVGKASSYGDWVITVSCYVSVLVGLCATLSLLTFFRKALPALPISIAFGLTSALLSYYVAVPLSSELTINQIFV